MTVDTFREYRLPSLMVGLTFFKQTLSYITKIFGYGVLLVVYASIFIISIATLALIEIRQSNLKDFDALIAILEQQERYFSNGRFEQVLTGLAKDIDRYRYLNASLPCSDNASRFPTSQANPIEAAAENANGASGGQTKQPQSCAEVKLTAEQHLYGLLSLQDNLVFQKAKLPKYYDEYTDGLRDKAPQLIPLLRYVDSKNEVVTAWARLPLELLEMLLLVCMGALGGVIAVTRCFVDTSSPNPRARDLCYRPVAGAVIALGIYVLFRATQLFFGGGSQNGGATISTSVFLLAALGLASGFCSREAVAQIERVATRLLRGTGNGDGGEKAEENTTVKARGDQPAHSPA